VKLAPLAGFLVIVQQRRDPEFVSIDSVMADAANNSALVASAPAKPSRDFGFMTWRT
jgi:hypothetical protein